MNKQVVNDKDEQYFIQKRHPDYYSIPNGKIAKSMMYNSYKDANAIMAKRNAGSSSQLAGDRFNTVVDNELLRLINQLEIIEKNF